MRLCAQDLAALATITALGFTALTSKMLFKDAKWAHSAVFYSKSAADVGITEDFKFKNVSVELSICTLFPAVMTVFLG